MFGLTTKDSFFDLVFPYRVSAVYYQITPADEHADLCKPRIDQLASL